MTFGGKNKKSPVSYDTKLLYGGLVGIISLELAFWHCGVLALWFACHNAITPSS